MKLVKVTQNNDPNDKSLCVLVQDASPFDGAVVRYTSFKLVEQENSIRIFEDRKYLFIPFWIVDEGNKTYKEYPKYKFSLKKIKEIYNINQS